MSSNRSSIRSVKRKSTNKYAEWTKQWTRSAADEQAVEEGCYFDLDAAEHVREFFRRFLRHAYAPWKGQPFELLDWQWNDLIAPLFGWMRADGSRRYRRAYIEVPKKNGKSTLCAGISLYMLLADGEACSEVYSAAADREQAGIIFREAAKMVRASPALSDRLKVIDHTKRIVFQQSSSFYNALSADVPSKDGLNWHGVIFDELHRQKTRDLWDVLSDGGAARTQPLLISITTAGHDRTSICWEQREYARSIIEGTNFDSSYFALIYGADIEDDISDPKVWAKANPSYGVTLKESEFREKYRLAVSSPLEENKFRRLRLNQWTQQDVRWLKLSDWDKCGHFDADDLLGKPCYGGLDLSSTTDTTAFVLVFPFGDAYSVLPFIWVPEEAAKQRERVNRQRYTSWIKQGHMMETEGNVIDQSFIRAKMNELAKLYDIRQIAIDPWGAPGIITQLQGDGFEIVEFRQGYASMSGPCKELERLVLQGKLLHNDHPVMRWMAGNVAVEQDPAGNIKPSKSKSTEKIDGIVATVMGLGLCCSTPEETASVYETRGVLSF